MHTQPQLRDVSGNSVSDLPRRYPSAGVSYVLFHFKPCRQTQAEDSLGSKPETNPCDSSKMKMADESSFLEDIPSSATGNRNANSNSLSSMLNPPRLKTLARAALRQLSKSANNYSNLHSEEYVVPSTLKFSSKLEKTKPPRSKLSKKENLSKLGPDNDRISKKPLSVNEISRKNVSAITTEGEMQQSRPILKKLTDKMNDSTEQIRDASFREEKENVHPNVKKVRFAADSL